MMIKHKNLLLVFFSLTILMLAGGWYYAAKQIKPIYYEDKSPAVAKEEQIPKPLSVAATGDLSCPAGASVSSEACQFNEVSALIKKQNPDAVLLLGDLQYEKGELEGFNNVFDKEWQELKAISYPVPGNHEYDSKNASGYYAYWQNRAADPSKGYYSFNLGGWHFLALNSNCSSIGGCGADSEQGKWLAADLAANQTACTLAYWHHPFFTSGNYTANSDARNRGKDFWRILFDKNADVVLSGHDHLYERFGPQNPDGGRDGAKGIRQFTVGTGGRSLYQLKTPIANHEAGQDEHFGALFLKLYPKYYEWEFINTSGAVMDKGRSDCH